MKAGRFRWLVRAVLVSAGPPAALVMGSACSASDVTEMPERAACVDLRAPGKYAALTLATGVDGVALATRGSFNGTVGSGSPAPQSLPPLGTPCATAGDREACAKSVDALLNASSSSGWTIRISECGGCGSESINDLGVITSGDSVRSATLDDLVRAAAPVDNREEAATILQLKGYTLDCDMNNVRRDDDGWTFKRTSHSCSGEVDEAFFKVLAATGQVIAAGTHQVHEKDTNCIEGRRPANLAPTGVAWLSSLSACFAEIAHMEAAAVLAFDELELQLRGLGAPPELLARAARAKQDEVAHAAITGALAQRFCGTPSAPHVEPTASANEDGERLVFRLALANAVEGCVREAYGAVVAAHQAAHASDPDVRAAFARIAMDEADHAELSFDLDAWLAPQLTDAERRRVDAAKARAWVDLAASCAEEPAAEVIAVAGLPSAARARALLANLAWALHPLAA